MRPAKTQISLYICAVWSESLLIPYALYSFRACLIWCYQIHLAFLNPPKKCIHLVCIVYQAYVCYYENPQSAWLLINLNHLPFWGSVDPIYCCKQRILSWSNLLLQTEDPQLIQSIAANRGSLVDPIYCCKQRKQQSTPGWSTPLHGPIPKLSSSGLFFMSEIQDTQKQNTVDSRYLNLAYLE